MFNPIAVLMHVYIIAAAALLSPWFLLGGAIVFALNMAAEATGR